MSPRRGGHFRHRFLGAPRLLPNQGPCPIRSTGTVQVGWDSGGGTPFWGSVIFLSVSVFQTNFESRYSLIHVRWLAASCFDGNMYINSLLNLVISGSHQCSFRMASSNSLRASLTRRPRRHAEHTVALPRHLAPRSSEDRLKCKALRRTGLNGWKNGY